MTFSDCYCQTLTFSEFISNFTIILRGLLPNTTFFSEIISYKNDTFRESLPNNTAKQEFFKSLYLMMLTFPEIYYQILQTTFLCATFASIFD